MIGADQGWRPGSGPMKRTIHGEALEYRPGGPLAGIYLRRRFQVQAVWCPACGAAPGVRCVESPKDRQARADHDQRQGLYLAAGLAAIPFQPRPGAHQERADRALDLEALAAQGAPVLYRLAVLDAGRAHQERRPLAGLPLFSNLNP